MALPAEIVMSLEEAMADLFSAPQSVAYSDLTTKDWTCLYVQDLSILSQFQTNSFDIQEMI